jgi:class 3 adenylate cyclase/pSer/pThr/pTyr-binding forkhead associated (FHA) protein
MLAILYVDIVGSTRFYDEHGNTAGLVMVQKCLDLLMPIIEREHGIVVKTIGDAILARFENVPDSIRAGVAMVRGSEQRNRGRAKTDEIHIHVGINYGLCLLKDNDVFGDVVNVAARIEGAAGVDEIVVSPSVFEEVRFVPEFRVRKKSSGVELKGKSAKLDLYTVLWRDDEVAAPAAVPPPPSADQFMMASGVHPTLAEITKRKTNSTPPVAAAKPAPVHTIANFSLAKVRHDGSLEKGFVLDKPGVTAGHHGDIVIAGDPQVAPQHARFTQLVDQVFVEDLGSPQGVYLRLRKPHRLSDGDIAQFGQQKMRFSLDAKTGHAALIRLGPHQHELERRPVHEPETVIGRSKGDFIFPNDPYLSSRHATVAHRDGKYWLEDVGSTNGTFVRIKQRAFVRDGDTLLIGNQSLRVVGHGSAGSGI